MTTERERYRISLVRKDVEEPQEDTDLFVRDTDVSLETARIKAKGLALANSGFDVWIQDVFTQGLEIWRMGDRGILGPIGSIDVTPQTGEAGFTFGLPEEGAAELKSSGPGPAMTLQFPAGDQSVSIGELGIPSPVDYGNFLQRIIDDSAFVPGNLPTPGFLVSDIRNALIARFGELPPNWERSLRDQLTRAYTSPFDQFIEATGGFGGRPRGRPRDS